MFEDVGSKLKSLAKFFFGLHFILLPIFFIAAVINEVPFTNILLITVVYIPIILLSCWSIYGFGILIENSEIKLDLLRSLEEHAEKSSIVLKEINKK